MKRVGILTVLVVCLFVVSTKVNATGFRRGFSNYQITSVEDIYVGKNVKAIWKLSYCNTEIPVTIVKRKTADGAEFVVYSKFFEVSYAATAKGFGTKVVRRAWSDVPRKISRAVINQEQMKRQQIITPDKIDDKMALGLIASYLPDLLNDDYTHLLN
jgi:hypothetical protein